MSSNYFRDQAVSSKSQRWYTPDRFVESARKVLQNIDLDPASDAIANTWVDADLYFTEQDDGLSKTWNGQIFLNPPFNMSDKFVKKLFEEWNAGTVSAAILLCKFVPNYKWFQILKPWPMVVLRDRVNFWTGYEVGGTSVLDCPITFIYFGPEDKKEAFYTEFSKYGDKVTFNHQCSGGDIKEKTPTGNRMTVEKTEDL